MVKMKSRRQWGFVTGYVRVIFSVSLGYTIGMKWYRSLKARSSFFFMGLGLLFVVMTIITFSIIKDSELERKAEERVLSFANRVVNKIIVGKEEARILTRDASTVIGASGKPGYLKMLLENMGEEGSAISSGAVWFSPEYAEENGLKPIHYFVKEESGKLKEFSGYAGRLSSDYSKSRIYAVASEIGDIFWTSVYMDEVRKKRLISVVSPIYRDGAFIGAVSIDIDIDRDKRELLDQIELSGNSYFVLTDRCDNFIAVSRNLIPFLSDANVDGMNWKILMRDDKVSEISDMETARRIVKKCADIDLNEALKITSEVMQTQRSLDGLPIVKTRLIEKDRFFGVKSVLTTLYFPDTGWRLIVSMPKSEVTKDMDELFNQLAMTVIVFSILFAVAGYAFLNRDIIDPIISLSMQIRRYAGKAGATLVTKDEGEIGVLAKSFNESSKALEESRRSEALNEKLLMQQSKMAAVGEMLDAVAHQWKQPLNALSMYVDMLVADYKRGGVDEKYITEYREDILVQIRHMINTLNTFRSFFRPGKEMKRFSLLQSVSDVLLLSKDDLLKNRIDVEILRREDFEIFGQENEFKHLILNLIGNSKDAFTEKGIEKRKIYIRIYSDDSGDILEVEDNAGGVDVEPIEKIFEPHFTTKDEGKGTGIGLYMSMQIARKHGAVIDVVNTGEGARFRISFSRRGADAGAV